MTQSKTDNPIQEERYCIVPLGGFVLYDTRAGQVTKGFIFPLISTIDPIKNKLPDQSFRKTLKLPMDELPRIEGSHFKSFLSSGDTQTQLPVQLEHIRNIIEESRRLAGLPDNWDGEGSKGCNEATWQRAANILSGYAITTWNTLNHPIPQPRIMPDFEGGIDLHWTSETYELVLNIPANPHEPVTYFGNVRSNPETVKTIGQLLSDETNHPGVLSWLACLR